MLEKVEDFTVNKLCHSFLISLHGRHKEKEILNTCLENVEVKDNKIINRAAMDLHQKFLWY
jgi:hypothetical protein